jgi:uncharacterized membrane protein
VARGRPALFLAGLAAIGLAISLYLSANEIAGTAPVCMAGGGCETVAASQYSHWFGIPVAFFGVLFSGVLVARVVAWWRTGDGRLLLAVYAQGLIGVVLELYLVYLELFVISAICEWCMAYGATVALGWLSVVVVQRRPGRAVGEV